VSLRSILTNDFCTIQINVNAPFSEAFHHILTSSNNASVAKKIFLNVASRVVSVGALTGVHLSWRHLTCSSSVISVVSWSLSTSAWYQQTGADDIPKHACAVLRHEHMCVFQVSCCGI